MNESNERQLQEILDEVYRSESRRILATLIRLLGDFDLAEDALHDAFRIALEQWAEKGIPDNPRAWLVSTGRFKAIDHIRRQSRFDVSLKQVASRLETDNQMPEESINLTIKDDHLRLIFTCCHPDLSPDARIALTLREVCGLTTEEIARAFLTSPATLAQRIVRAKAKIRDEKIPFQVPPKHRLAGRLNIVLHVIYLIFNEGYSATGGNSITRDDLSGEAIRLGRLLYDLMPEPEVSGLLALMLLQESRHKARSTPNGDLVLLEEQDRSLWNRDQINEGINLVENALRSRRFGPYTLQAAIAAVHAEASRASETDWAQIVALYDRLLRVDPSPVIELNRAVAVAMSEGPLEGLNQIDSILARGELNSYHLAHSARADLCRRLGKTDEAKASYERALSIAEQEPERRFLEGKLAQLG